MKQLFLNNELKQNSIYYLSKKDSHHLKNVIRIKEYDEIYVLDNTYNKFLCKINNINTNGIIEILVIEKISSKNRDTIINLYFPLIRPTRLDIIFEKCTELGVSSYKPFISQNTSYPKKMYNQNRIIRWKTKIKSSVQQCGRNTIPSIDDIINIKDIKKPVNCLNILLDENSNVSILSVLEKRYKCDISINIFIGPEGGFTDEEKEYLINELKCHPCIISNNILRTETACMSSVSVCNIYIQKDQRDNI